MDDEDPIRWSLETSEEWEDVYITLLTGVDAIVLDSYFISYFKDALEYESNGKCTTN